MDLFNFIGIGGGALYLLSYALLNAGKVTGDSYGYIGLNLAASVCMAVSLFVHWNGPSFALQLCWIAISGVGILNRFLAIRKQKRLEQPQQGAILSQLQV